MFGGDVCSSHGCFVLFDGLSSRVAPVCVFGLRCPEGFESKVVGKQRFVNLVRGIVTSDLSLPMFSVSVAEAGQDCRQYLADFLHLSIFRQRHRQCSFARDIHLVVFSFAHDIQDSRRIALHYTSGVVSPPKRTPTASSRIHDNTPSHCLATSQGTFKIIYYSMSQSARIHLSTPCTVA